VCAAGAVSPGPSLALVLGRALAGGRAAGVRVALGHGAGVGLYALGAASGIGALIRAHPTAFTGLQAGGAAFLGWMGLQLLRSARRPGVGVAPDGDNLSPATVARVQARPSVDLRDGFLLAFLNPKIAVFFAALFSQVVDPAASAGERLGMGALAAAIDTGWYLLVAAALGGPALSAWLGARRRALDLGTGLVLLGLAGLMAARLTAG
jgi:threonine/homoserine/homoserine lactone efflux protein